MPNIKIDQNRVPAVSFFVVQFSDDVRDTYTKKLSTILQRKIVVGNCHRSGTDRLVNKKMNEIRPMGRAYQQFSSPCRRWWLYSSCRYFPYPCRRSSSLACGIQINGNNQHCAICLDLESHINNTLPLVGDADDLPLSGATLLLADDDLPLAGGIWINGNNLHCAIHLDPVLKLHDLDGKHNPKGIYHNKVMPPVRSSIHF